MFFVVNNETSKTMIMANVELGAGELLSRLELFFNEENLERLARKSRFVERSTSRISGWMFLQLHLMMLGNGKELSLTEMCESLHESHGINLSKQSLDERFNTFSVNFMRSCFEHIFHKLLTFKGADAGHSHFKRVILTDSTCFQLPAHLAGFYKSNGGDTSGAGIKIQQQYELLTGRVLSLALGDSKANDAVFLEKLTLEDACQELHLMDLGYFKFSHLKALEEKGGFYISRYKTGTAVFCKDEKGGFNRLQWSEILKNCQQRACLPEVYLGNEKLKVRLIVEKLPNHVKDKRLKKYKAKEANQSQSALYHWQVSDTKKLLCGYNIFITNCKEEQLSPEQVSLYYRLRWQIELVFKIWKSIIEIDKVGQMSIFRFECYLYSRLIAILLTSQVSSLLKQSLQKEFDLELSEWKTMKYLKKSNPAL